VADASPDPGSRPGGRHLDPGLVIALLAARDDPATTAFDEALETAVASGRLDPATARELRYWQRRSLEGLAEHAAVVLPATVVARHSSDATARESVAEARMSWQQATALAREAAPAAPDVTAEPETPGVPFRRSGGAGLTVVSDDD